MVGPLDALSVRAVWPQGPILDQDGKPTGNFRERSLVKVYTDPGGYRVVAAADIWGKDPGRNDSQW